MTVTFLISFLLSVVAVRALIPLAPYVGLVDKPCVRKRHSGSIPLVGGVAIYLCLLVLSLYFPFWNAQYGVWLVLLGFPMVVIGLLDDKWQLSASKRLVIEAIIGLVAVLNCGIKLDELGELVPGLGGSLVLMAVPFTLLGRLGVINAINMTDGVDGLAGGLSLLTFAALGCLAYSHNPQVAMQLLCFVAVLLGFLVFNSRFFGRKHAAVFMGDGGSIFLGFALAWYLIQLSQGANAAYQPVTALWLFAVPLIDTITIMVRRMRHGHSPFAADREHLHHILLLAGFGANRTVLIILASHLCCILFGVAGLYFGVPEWVMFFLFAALFAGYFYSMTHAWKLMKKVKHFREWAGFEDRRHEGDAEGARKDRRTVEVDIDGEDRRKGARSGQA